MSKDIKNELLPYTNLLIKLMRGTVEYVDKTAWEQLLRYQTELVVFLQQLGLLLIIDKEDGYAYLEQIRLNDDDHTIGWMRRTPLTYDESVMLVLLRDIMADFEVGEATNRELIKKQREIKEYAELFFKENISRVRFVKELDKLIDKVQDLGFLELLENNEVSDERKFRIKKLIKARVDNEVLANFKQQLEDHATQRI